jgi:uncharacterized membrane protein YgcG
MKTYISMLVAVIATLFAVNASAWNPPASPAPKSWISDVGGTLSPEAHARLDVQLRQINSGSANEVAALILPSLDGESIEDVANATFKAWGVGKKDLDNGVLVVLAMKEHKSRIETGKGVEGDLPDLKTHDILDNVVKPRMRQHKVEAALSEAFNAISTSIANHKAEAEAAKARAATNPAPAPVATTSDTSAPSRPICDASSVGASSGGLWAILIMGMAALVIYMARRLTRNSPVKPAPAPEPVVVAKTVAHVSFAPPAPILVRAPPPPPVAPPAPKKAKAKVSGMTNIPKTPPRPAPKAVKKATMPTVVATAAVASELAAATRVRAKREQEEREEENRRTRRAQEAREERAEEERRRKRREEDEESSSSSSSSTFDWGGGSSGGGSDSGSGGFGGGDSGGGGSSSDW